MVYDVAVVGGGRAGSAVARQLAAAGRKVLVVDRPGRRRMSESLVPAARNLLSDLGVWESFQQDGHLPCNGNETLWGDVDGHGTDFVRSPYGHGWLLDGPRLDDRLREAARDRGATVWIETQFAGLEAERGGDWVLSLVRSDRRRQDVRSRFVIDASGRSHRVAHSLGIPRRFDDGLVAFQARFEAAGDDGGADIDTRNRVEAVAEGWWYTARVPAGTHCERSAVFFTERGSSWAAQAGETEGFLALLGAAPATRRKIADHGYTLLAGPEATDARSSRLEQLHGDGWLAIGDAAMALDPLSSQGIFTALYGGVKAASAVLSYFDGDTEALAEFGEDLDNVYIHFQQNRDRVYRLERRWPESPFWASRQKGSQA